MSYLAKGVGWGLFSQPACSGLACESKTGCYDLRGKLRFAREGITICGGTFNTHHHPFSLSLPMMTGLLSLVLVAVSVGRLVTAQCTLTCAAGQTCFATSTAAMDCLESIPFNQVNKKIPHRLL